MLDLSEHPSLKYLLFGILYFSEGLIYALASVIIVLFFTEKDISISTTALVGGIRTRECMDRIIEYGIADMISMCRPFIKEQDLVTKLKAGKNGADCISCNRHSEIMRKMMLHCPLDR